MRSVQFIIILSVIVLTSTAAYAQALPTASRSPIQVGVGVSFASADFGPDYIKGISAFGDYGFTRRFSAEVSVHQLTLSTPDGIGEATYLVGPRYSVALEDRANIYIKALGGLGRFTYEPSNTITFPHTETHGVIAFGAGVEFRASTHVNVRAIDVEYQSWPGFPPHGLTPFAATIGVAYVR